MSCSCALAGAARAKAIAPASAHALQADRASGARLVIARERIGRSLQRGQRIAPVVERFRVFRRNGEGAIKATQRFVVTSELRQHDATIAQGLRIGWLEYQRA